MKRLILLVFCVVGALLPAAAASGEEPAPELLIAGNDLLPASVTTLIDDDFTQAANTQPPNPPWEVNTGSLGYLHEACGQSDTGNIREDGASHLLIVGLKEANACRRPYTSGDIDSAPRLYGPPKSGQTIETAARMNMPCGSGPWTGFWQTGVQSGMLWPNKGETNIVEWFGGSSTATQTVHGATTTGGHWQKNWSLGTVACDTWHTYGVRWSLGKLVFTFDGDVSQTVTPATIPTGAVWPFDSYPQKVRLTLALGDYGGTVDRSKLPFAWLTDWVKVTCTNADGSPC